MTRKLFYDDPYMDRFDATVLDAGQGLDGLQIILDQTAFFPEAGGQPCDLGQLNGVKVIKVIENDDEEIIHTVASGKFCVGDKIKGVVDISRRLENMRRHTGQHILSRAFVETAGVDTICANHGETGTIELSVASLTDEQMEQAERLANEIVMRNLPVSARIYDEKEIRNLPLRKIPDREGSFRIVHIGDFDTNACGGTHCRYTGEVGPIKIIGTEKLRGHFRISFLCGNRALDDYREKHRVVTTVAANLTCHYSSLPEKTDRLAAENLELRRSLAQQSKQLFEFELTGLIQKSREFDGVKLLVRHFPKAEPNQVKDMILFTAARVKSVILFSTEDRLLIACSESAGLKANDLAQEFMGKFGGKGGGAAALAQVGSIPGDRLQEYIAVYTKTIEAKLVK